MPRPTSKAALIAGIEQEKQALDQFLATLTPEQMVSTPMVGDWTPRDVLAHLAEWQRMFLEWYTVGKRGEKPVMPAPGYKWSQTPALNQMIYEKYAEMPLEEIRAMFQANFTAVFDLLQTMSEEELFTPRYYAWTGTSTLLLYMIANTSSHYRWARTEMRKSLSPRRARA